MIIIYIFIESVIIGRNLSNKMKKTARLAGGAHTKAKPAQVSQENSLVIDMSQISCMEEPSTAKSAVKNYLSFLSPTNSNNTRHHASLSLGGVPETTSAAKRSSRTKEFLERTKPGEASKSFTGEVLQK